MIDLFCLLLSSSCCNQQLRDTERGVRARAVEKSVRHSTVVRAAAAQDAAACRSQRLRCPAACSTHKLPTQGVTKEHPGEDLTRAGASKAAIIAAPPPAARRRRKIAAVLVAGGPHRPHIIACRSAWAARQTRQPASRTPRLCWGARSLVPAGAGRLTRPLAWSTAAGGWRASRQRACGRVGLGGEVGGSAGVRAPPASAPAPSRRSRRGQCATMAAPAPAVTDSTGGEQAVAASGGSDATAFSGSSPCRLLTSFAHAAVPTAALSCRCTRPRAARCAACT